MKSEFRNNRQFQWISIILILLKFVRFWENIFKSNYLSLCIADRTELFIGTASKLHVISNNNLLQSKSPCLKGLATCIWGPIEGDEMNVWRESRFYTEVIPINNIFEVVRKKIFIDFCMFSLISFQSDIIKAGFERMGLSMGVSKFIVIMNYEI